MPTDPINRVIREALQAQRYGNGIVRDIAQRVEDARQRIEAAIIRRDPTAVSAGYRARRLEALGAEIDALLNDMYSDVRKIGNGSLVDYAQVSEKAALATLRSAVGTVAVEIGGKRISREFWRSIVTTEPIQGAMINDWWTRQADLTKFNVRRQLQLGLANHETVDDIVRRVRGRSIGGGRYRGGVVAYDSAATRQAAALVRTGITQIQTKAHIETYRQHDDVTKEWRFVATLDDRTTPQCAANDGKTFPYGEGPEPPLHWNCRSVPVPVVDFEGLGLTPPVEGERASVDGPVPANMNYAQWLKGQPASVQAEVLGVGKARLFREGKITLGQIVRSDNSIVTLKELQQKAGS